MLFSKMANASWSTCQLHRQFCCKKILGNNTTVKMLLCKMAMLCQASWLLGNLGYTKKKYFEFSICVSFSSVCDASPRVSLCAGLAWQTVSAPSPRTTHLWENWKSEKEKLKYNHEKEGSKRVKLKSWQINIKPNTQHLYIQLRDKQKSCFYISHQTKHSK